MNAAVPIQADFTGRGQIFGNLTPDQSLKEILLGDHSLGAFSFRWDNLKTHQYSSSRYYYYKDVDCYWHIVCP